MASDTTLATKFYVNGAFVPPWQWAKTQPPVASQEWTRLLSQLRLKEINAVYVQWRMASDAAIRDSRRNELDDLLDHEMHSVIQLASTAPMSVAWQDDSHVVVGDGVTVLYTDVGTYINALASYAKAKVEDERSVAHKSATSLLNIGYTFYLSDSSLRTERARLLVLDLAWSQALTILQMLADARQDEEESRQWQIVATQFVDLISDLKRVNIRRRGGD